MADNRLLIRCRICGETVPIARVSAGDDDWTPARAEAIEEWRVFLIAHGRCGAPDPQERYGRGCLHVELTSENGRMFAAIGEVPA